MLGSRIRASEDGVPGRVDDKIGALDDKIKMSEGSNPQQAGPNVELGLTPLSGGARSAVTSERVLTYSGAAEKLPEAPDRVA